MIAILRDEQGHMREFEGFLREYEAEGQGLRRGPSGARGCSVPNRPSRSDDFLAKFHND